MKPFPLFDSAVLGTTHPVHRQSSPYRAGAGTAMIAVAWMAASLVGTSKAAELSEPYRVTAGGVPIDVDVGHAAPLVVDFDGDHLPDLLVGQFGNGQLRIYRNRGTAKAPEFSTFAWFQADGAGARVPAG